MAQRPAHATCGLDITGVSLAAVHLTAALPRSLWCVMEIFVFVQMGGERERAVILPLTDDADLLGNLVRFSAGEAQCFLPGDRHKLLATIEASFGTFHPFNKIVSSIFQDKLVQLSTGIKKPSH